MNDVSNQTVVSLGTTEREQKRAIPEAVFYLNNDIGILENLIDKLCESLRPIMRIKGESGGEPCGEPKMPGGIAASPLATELTTLHLQFCVANDRLREILRQVEL